MTTPASEQTQDKAAPHLVVEATYLDPITGALYIHEDLRKVRDDWTAEKHISPVKADEHFGDVESWSTYVKNYGSSIDLENPSVLVTWNSLRLKAVLDYHENEVEPGRCQWTASHPFTRSREWNAWTALANGQAIPQRKAIEFLEDQGEDIVDPPAADLMLILRNLRAHVTASANTELRADGGTSVQFSQEKRVAGAANNVDLPSEIAVTIPVLHGHVDREGRPVKYRLAVRVRASVDDQAHLALRFSIPSAEKVLDEVISERVNQAKELLGGEFRVLRGTG